MDLAGILGIALGVLGIIVTIVIFLIQKKRKRLIYEVTSDSPLLVTEGISGQLDVSYNGKRVENARLMTVRIANSGNVPIEVSDFHSEIRVIGAEQGVILSADVVETVPTSLQPEVKTEISDNTLKIEPLLLNARDSLALSLFMDQAVSDIRVEARIAGIADLERKVAVPSEVQTAQAWDNALKWAVGTAVAGGVTALYSTLLN